MSRKKQPRHKWLAKDRTILCLLTRWYKREDIAEIFHKIFRRKLVIEGLTGDATAILLPKLKAQLREMERGGKGYEIFANITYSTEDDLERSYHIQLQEIRQAARLLGIQALPVIVQPDALTGNAETSTNPVRRRRRLRSVSVSVTLVTDSESEREVTTSTIQLRQFVYREDSAPILGSATIARRHLSDFRDELPEPPITPQLQITKDANNNKIPSHPLLLFRATTSINHFRARKFSPVNSVIPPPAEFNSPDWRAIAIPHLQHDKAYPSRLISLAQNPKNAISRVDIKTSEEIDKKIYLAIFEFNAIKTDAESRFGTGTGPYLVRNMFRDGEPSGLPNGYTGPGEWLAYGSIEAEPIAVLNAGQAISLNRSFPRLKLGEVAVIDEIAHSLTTIPDIWKEAVAYRLLQTYCPKTEWAKLSSPSYEIFMSKIYKRHESSTAIVSQSHDQDMDWTVISRHFTDKTANAEDDEVEEEESEEDEQPIQTISGNTTPFTRPLVVVNIPRCRDDTQTRATSHTVLNKLNSMASKAIQRVSPQRNKVLRRQPSRLWSTDSESDSGDVIAEKLESRGPKSGYLGLQPLSMTLSFSSNTTNPLQLTGTNDDNDDDWDLIENTLEESFTKSYPSAAKKIRTSYPKLNTKAHLHQNEDEVLPSIEPTLNINGLDQFTNELVAKASAVTPTPMPPPSSPPPAPFCSPPHFPVYSHPIWKADYATSTWHIDLTKSLAVQVDRSKPRTITATPKKRPLPTTNDDDEEDEDFVITSSGRRQRIRLPFRSLSVMEAEVIALE